MRRIEAEEGRYFVHLFNGYRPVKAWPRSAMSGRRKRPIFEAGSCRSAAATFAAGVATAMRLANPRVHVYGVEPEGSMRWQKLCRQSHDQDGPYAHHCRFAGVAAYRGIQLRAFSRRHIDHNSHRLRRPVARGAMLTLFGQLASRRTGLRRSDGGAAWTTARNAARQTRRRAVVRHQYRSGQFCRAYRTGAP